MGKSFKLLMALSGFFKAEWLFCFLKMSPFPKGLALTPAGHTCTSRTRRGVIFTGSLSSGPMDLVH